MCSTPKTRDKQAKSVYMQPGKAKKGGLAIIFLV
jgi:hypothetical protein